MRNSNTGLCHGTSGSPQESIESLEYAAKVQEIEKNLKEEFGHPQYPKETLSNLGNTEYFTQGAIKHIFEGEVNDKGKAVGYHYEGVENAKGHITPGTRSPSDKHGVYEANVSVDGVVKRIKSTFFPRDWTPQQVVNAINEAYGNKVHVSGNKYSGDYQGIQIEMYLTSEGKIKSAYPVKEIA